MTSLSASNETAVADGFNLEKMKSLLEDAKTTFKIRGDYIHPLVIKEFENWISDAGLPYTVSIDANAAMGTNKFFGDVIETKSPFCEAPALTSRKKEEFYEYTFVGKTEEGLCIIFSRCNGGGTLTTCTLHLVELSLQESFTSLKAQSEAHDEQPESEIKPRSYYQLAIKSIFQCDVGFAGSITVEGNTVVIENKEFDKRMVLELPSVNR